MLAAQLEVIRALTRRPPVFRDEASQPLLRLNRSARSHAAKGCSVDPRLRRDGELLRALHDKQTVQNTAQQTVDRQLVLAALRTLSIEHRQALFETYFRGASVAEAAGTLGVPPGTVKSRTHYALRALRQEIDKTEASASTDLN